MLHHKLAHETIFLTSFLIGSTNGRIFLFDQSEGSSHVVNSFLTI